MRLITHSLVAIAALLGAACAGSSAKVVSSSGALPIPAAQAAPAQGPMLRIAVSNFEWRAGQGSGDVGEGMSDMLTTALANSGRFIVLERERLNEVMQEQDLAATGRFDQSTAAPKGELEGAQLLVRGSITEFEPKCSGGSALIVGTGQACIAVNLRIVDARTGRVLNATTVQGTAAKSMVGLVFAGELAFGLGAYKKTPMATAIRNCIELAVQHIVETKL